MTRQDFLTALHEAIATLKPVLMVGPGYWPRGPYLRFVVNRRAGESDAVPPVVDPIGLIWYAKTYQLKPPPWSPQVAGALGLSPLEAGWIILVSDGKGAGEPRLVEALELAARQCQERFA